MASIATDQKIEDEAEPTPTSICVPTLLEEHAAEIKKLRGLVERKLAPEPVPSSDGIACEYDDIFYLRYILSFRTAEKAIGPVLTCFKFREDPKNRRISEMAKDNTIEKELAAMVEAPRWQVAGPLSKTEPGTGLNPQSGGGVFVIIRAAMCDSSGFFDSITKDEMWEMNVAHREGSFQFCDRLTRETGKLAKMTMCMDMTGASISSMMDRRQSGVHAEISKVAANVYPQLQDKFCIVNAPSWMGWIMSLFRKIASKRSVDKVELFTSEEEMWSSEWAQNRLIRERLPAFMGGSLADADLPSELTGELREQAPPPELTIGGRSSETIRVDVPFEGESIVKFVVSVLTHGIELSARFVEHKQTGRKGETKENKSGSRKSSDGVVLRKGGKVKADSGPIRGEWSVQGPGTVEVCFDNTYSMLRSKTVRYKFEAVPVVPPDSEKEDFSL